MMGAGALTDKAVVMIELRARLGRNGYLDAGEGDASLRAAEPRPRRAPQDCTSDRGFAVRGTAWGCGGALDASLRVASSLR